jgi:hypothetical protein
VTRVGFAPPGLHYLNLNHLKIASSHDHGAPCRQSSCADWASRCRTNRKETAVEIMRPPNKRNTTRSRVARKWSEMPGDNERFERVSRWLFWMLLFAGTAIAFLFRY